MEVGLQDNKCKLFFQRKVNDFLPADIPRSGFLSTAGMERKHERLMTLCQSHLVTLLATEPGSEDAFFWTHCYPYCKVPLNNMERPAVPRFFYSRRDEKLLAKMAKSDNDKEIPFVEPRYDYGAGRSGTTGFEEGNRVIRRMPVDLEEIADIVWDIMKKDDRYKDLTKKTSNKFNHATILTYMGHNKLTMHADQVWSTNGKFDEKKNSQKKDTPVVVITVGAARRLAFHRRGVGKCGQKWCVPEKEIAMLAIQKHGDIFLLHHKDEFPTRRRDGWGIEFRRMQFLHRVMQPPAKERDDYLSIAIVLRCVESTVLVDITTNTVSSNKDVSQSISKREKILNKARSDPMSTDNKLAKKRVGFFRRKLQDIFKQS